MRRRVSAWIFNSCVYYFKSQESWLRENSSAAAETQFDDLTFSKQNLTFMATRRCLWPAILTKHLSGFIHGKLRWLWGQFRYEQADMNIQCICIYHGQIISVSASHRTGSRLIKIDREMSKFPINSWSLLKVIDGLIKSKKKFIKIKWHLIKIWSKALICDKDQFWSISKSYLGHAFNSKAWFQYNSGSADQRHVVKNYTDLRALASYSKVVYHTSKFLKSMQTQLLTMD